MIQQEINLNLIPSSEPVVVHCNQYDEGKARIIAHLYNGSHPYTPGANATVKVQGTKPDNHAFQYWCDISGSTVTVDVNVQMTAVAGRTPTQLIVNETSGVTGSFAFYLDVQASTLPPDIDVSETDLPILTEEAQEAARRAVQAAGAAEDSADRAASWSSNPPYIGANDNWFVYDINTEQFVDSGILARGTDGEDGERGSLWYRGTAVSGKSADPTIFPTGIADALAGDMYLNTTEGAVYHCVTGGSASVATWAYDFTLTGGGGGGGTDNYNDLINQPKINNVTLVGNKSLSDLGIKSGLYPYLYIDSEAGATVTVDAPDGSTIIPTPAGSGHWECELPAYGVYVIHSVLAGQGDATYSLTVDDVKEYHVTDSHYDFTINVIADAGSTVRVSAGTEVYTGTGTGSAVAFIVHQPSTVYTIEETLDGHTDTETVTSASTSGGSVTVTVHVFEAILNISTTSASLFGKSISIMKGGVSVGSTAFNNSGQATYAVHETGIYTLTCDGYTGSATVTTETTYNVTISAFNVTLNVTASAADGTTLTAKDGTNTETATVSNGKAEFNLSAGDWEVAGIPITVVAGQTYEKDVYVFAVHYSEADSNPDSADYPSGYNNYGWTPFAMNMSTGVPDYGSWNPSGINADMLTWFYPKSCMLKYDGTVDYYLDENDETKKADAVTPSDVANASYAGNAMMEWGQDGRRIYWKIVADTNNDGWTFIVANADVLGCKPWNHYDVNGDPNKHFYVHKYFGSSSGGKLRSISGQTNYVNNAGTAEISLAEANNTTSDKIWTTGVFCDTMLLGLLCVLLGKSLNTQAKFGFGRTASGNTSAIGQGTMNGKGMFFGKSNGTDGVKVFGTENLWGNLYQRIRGLININGSYRIKMTYDTTDGSTTDGYNTDGSGYINAGNIGATAAWVYPKHMIVRENVLLAQTDGGSETTYYCDGTYLAASGTFYAVVGGYWNNAGLAGAFFVNLNYAVSATNTAAGAALSCKPLAE